jgi:hypothetical protein
VGSYKHPLKLRKLLKFGLETPSTSPPPVAPHYPIIENLSGARKILFPDKQQTKLLAEMFSHIPENPLRFYIPATAEWN